MHVSKSHSSRYLETRNRYLALTVEEPNEHQDTSINREPFETRDTMSNHEPDDHQEYPLNPHEFETEGNRGSPSNRSSPRKIPDLGTSTGTSMPEVSNVTVLNDGLSDLYMLRVHGRVNGHKALILLDSGSTHDFVSEDFVRKHHLETQTDSLGMMFSRSLLRMAPPTHGHAFPPNPCIWHYLTYRGRTDVHRFPSFKV